MSPTFGGGSEHGQPRTHDGPQFLRSLRAQAELAAKEPQGDLLAGVSWGVPGHK